ncbi:MAG TPA: glycosyltransferase [Opitutaceae bacterium]|nr:glycosyltransferase [Opitutaceae bacterium]
MNIGTEQENAGQGVASLESAGCAHGHRVTQISTTDVRGGAALAAHRLHCALAGAGVRSQMLVAQRFGVDAGILEYNPFTPAPPALGRALFRLGRRWHRPSVRSAGAYFSPEWTLTGWRLLSQVPPCDVVNMHWVADLLDYRTLPRLAARVPVVWTFHDMNAFTGGCHYSGSCLRYREKCGACPQLITSGGEDDMTAGVMRRKLRILRRVPRSRLAIVCPSAWLARETLSSALFNDFDVRVIPNGLDPHQFHPMAPAEARDRLKLPHDARIVLFVADKIEDQRKGLGLLIKAFESVRDIPGLLLVTLGRGSSAMLAGLPCRHLGALHDPALLRAAYSAADVFAIPSRQDNLPNTILESMACGTPVVGFDVGGVGEAIVDGETGFLAPVGDAAAFAAALRRILEDPRLRGQMAHEARARVEKEYTVRLQALRYAALYREMLEAKPSAAVAA